MSARARFELGGGIGELVRDHLMAGQGHAEGRALLGVGDGLGEHHVGVADARGRGRHALVLELPHQLLEALAGLAADQVGVRHRNVVERDLGGVARPHPELAELARHAHAGQVGVDQEEGDATVPGTGLALHDAGQEVRARSVGDEHLATAHATRRRRAPLAW